MSIMSLAMLAMASRTEAKEIWKIEPEHSAVSFVVRYLLLTPLRARFSAIDGTVYFDEEDVEQSWVRANLDARSISTGFDKHDRRLWGREFFWPKQHASIVFRSTRIKRGQDGHLLVTGELTIRETTREVTLEVEGPSHVVRNEEGYPARAVMARTRLDRKDFGMTWNLPLEGGGVAFSDEVDVEVALTLVRTTTQANARAMRR